MYTMVWFKIYDRAKSAGKLEILQLNIDNLYNTAWSEIERSVSSSVMHITESRVWKDKVTSLEDELASTKAVYNKALITLTKRGRMIKEIDKDETINVDKSRELGKSHDTAEHRMESEHDDNDRTLAETLLNIKRSATKGKAIMQESEPPNKIKKKEIIHISLDEEFAKSFYEEEQAQILQDKVYVKQVEAQWIADEEYLKKQSRHMKGKNKEGAKRQKIEYEKEKEELKAYLDLVPKEEFSMEIKSLDGGSKNYKIFSEMLNNFDRQDVIDLHRLVEERYATSRPEGYDLMLWGDLKIIFQPDEEDEVWRHQHEYNLISCRLFDSCGIHILLMDNGIANHMMIEKKYPLTQEMLSKMLSKKLEVDHETEMAFELLRFIRSQTCKSRVELEYNIEECRQVVPVDYFFNNDLEYLREGSSSKKYTTSTTKTKAGKYDIPSIEDMVPSNMVSKHEVYSTKRIIAVTKVKVMKWYDIGYLEEIEVRREDQQLHKFKEGDFPRLHLHDIEYMLLLLVQKKLSNLEKDVIFDLGVALQIFTRRIVILKRVEDLQLGVKSYQKKLNITKPETFRSDISKKIPYTAYNNPQGIIYGDKYKRNRLMRTDELYKFSNRTLTYVRTVLHDIALNLRMDYLPKRIWSSLDRKRSRIMIKAIDQLLLERRLMRSLEKFVGGRDYGEDLRLLERTT
ncbi:hypothetical protein Tco_0222011 [Tanacetum coccineum]